MEICRNEQKSMNHVSRLKPWAANLLFYIIVLMEINGNESFEFAAYEF